MKKICVCCMMLFAMEWCVRADKWYQKFSPGIGTGYTSDRTFSAEVFIQMNIKLLHRPFEPKVGMVYHSHTTSFGDADGLEVQGAGLFMEGVVYPFRKYFYTGLRWELLNLYRFTDEAVDRMHRIPVYPVDIFGGTSFYGVAGAKIPLCGFLDVNIHAMPGIRQYNVSLVEALTGSRTFDGPWSEVYLKVVCRINVSLVIKIFDRRG